MTLMASMSRVVKQSVFVKNKFERSLTYNADSGSSTNVNYVPVSSHSREVDEAGGKYRIREYSVAVSSDSVAGITVPNVIDTVTIDAEEWAISDYTSDLVASHTLHLERREIIKKYRG